ncbi:MAG TPA: DUF5069 domain-containing protein [Opitutaceae bacterium]
MPLSYSVPDLTQHPPRSPRVRLGGFVHLPRLLDKARAFSAGKQGDYIYPCPLDKRFFDFTGISSDALLATVKSGKCDTEMLTWVQENASPKRTPYEVEAWSRWMESQSPGDPKRHAHFSEEITRLAPGRDDIRTTFDRLDLDDYVSFGGKG